MADFFLPLLIWGIILSIGLFLVQTLIKNFQFRNFSKEDRLVFIFSNISLIKILTYIISGFAIVSGLNLIFVTLSFYYPVTLQIQGNDALTYFLGGIVVICMGIFSVFNEEFTILIQSNSLKIGKIPLNDKLIKFYYEHSRYKEKTNNPQLKVIKFTNDNTIYVKTHEVRDYLTKNLNFCLKIYEKLSYDGKIELIDSLDIAECRFFKSGQKITIFKIERWINSSQYTEQIAKIKVNQDLNDLNPFIILSDNAIADECNYEEMENLVKTIRKLKMNIEER